MNTTATAISQDEIEHRIHEALYRHLESIRREAIERGRDEHDAARRAMNAWAGRMPWFVKAELTGLAAVIGWPAVREALRRQG